MMKKIAIVGLSVAAFATSCHHASAYSRTKRPATKTTVVLGSAGIGAATWGVSKLILSNPAWIGTTVGSHGFKVGIGTRLNPLSGKWSTIMASVAAGAATWIGWKAISSYTAPGYFKSGQEILFGKKCSNPEVLNLIKFAGGDSQEIAESVVDLFSVRTNELVKAADALESLFNQLSLANYYFEVAQRGFDEDQSDLVEGFREIVGEHISTIKSTLILIRKHDDYQQQYDSELKERAISAQYEMARATRDAAHTTRVHYNLN